jgi:hypothetical protein
MTEILFFHSKVLKTKLKFQILIPKEERRNMTMMYNPIKVKEFQHIFSIHDWVCELRARINFLLNNDVN